MCGGKCGCLTVGHCGLLSQQAFLQDARRDLLRVDSASSDRGTLHNLVGKPLREVGAAAFSEREGKVLPRRFSLVFLLKKHNNFFGDHF